MSQHTRSCPALTSNHEEECTCGLRYRVLFEKHVKWVEQFLNDMYATMVDPVEQPKMKVVEMCGILLKAAQENRDALYERDGQLAAIRQYLIGLKAYLATCAIDVIADNLETTVAGLSVQVEKLEAAIQREV